MAIEVQFYTFSKKPNSTARPSSASVSFSCELKEGCSIIYPIIGIDNGAAWNPSAYNYAKITDFNRYYYISDWSYSGGLWWATLTVDVLATWRTNIYNTTEYVLRSDKLYDGTIIDTLFPAKMTYQYSKYGWNGAGLTGSPWAQVINNGVYIVGIINSDASAIGAVSYYAFTSAQFGTFKSYLLGNLNWMADLPTDITENLFKALFNPFQYIVSVKWFPIAISSILGKTEISTITMGWWQLSGGGLSAYRLSVPFVDITHTLKLYSHPLSSTRGKYLNLSPYTIYRLFAPPFGIFDIDTVLAADLSYSNGSTDLSIGIRIDLISGNAHLTVYGLPDSSQNQIELLSIETQLSIDIQIAQIASENNTGNLMNDLAQGVSTVITGAKNVLKGKPFSAEGIQAQIGIADAAAIGSTLFSQIGANGSLSQFYLPFMVYSIHMDMTEDAKTDKGRPLCREITLSSAAPGFVITENSHISMPGTDYEINAVNEALDGGVFLG